MEQEPGVTTIGQNRERRNAWVGPTRPISPHPPQSFFPFCSIISNFVLIRRPAIRYTHKKYLRSLLPITPKNNVAISVIGIHRLVDLRARIVIVDGGDDQRLRCAPVSRAADRAPAEGGEGLQRRRGRAVQAPNRPAVHGKVRDGCPLRRRGLRHHQLRPDGVHLRRLRAGALPLVPRPRDTRRRPQLRPHLLRRRRHPQAVLPLSVRYPARLPPGRDPRSSGHPRRRSHCSPSRQEPIEKATVPAG